MSVSNIGTFSTFNQAGINARGVNSPGVEKPVGTLPGQDKKTKSLIPLTEPKIVNSPSVGQLPSVQDYADQRSSRLSYIESQAKLVEVRMSTVSAAFSSNPMNQALNSASRIAAQAPFEEAASQYKAAHQLIKEPASIRQDIVPTDTRI